MKYTRRFSVLLLLAFLLFLSCGRENLADIKAKDTPAPCDTTGITYNGVIKPLLNAQCSACHSPGGSGGYDLTAYADTKTLADNGKLLGAIRHQAGFSPMPQGGLKLSDCNIQKIERWVLNGAPNN